nr:hypothetical protein [Tanacetum cinerariifolium]
MAVSFAEYESKKVLLENRMVQKLVLRNMENGTVQREVRPVWNNAMRTNHQNFSNSKRNLTPTAVLTKSGIVPVSAARQSSSRAAAPVSFATFTRGLEAVVLIGPAALTGVAALEELCLAALTGTMPDLVKTVVGVKGYLINDGYADLVQHVGVYFNIAGVFLLGFHQHNKWSSIHHV